MLPERSRNKRLAIDVLAKISFKVHNPLRGWCGWGLEKLKCDRAVSLPAIAVFVPTSWSPESGAGCTAAPSKASQRLRRVRSPCDETGDEKASVCTAASMKLNGSTACAPQAGKTTACWDRRRRSAAHTVQADGGEELGDIELCRGASRTGRGGNARKAHGRAKRGESWARKSKRRSSRQSSSIAAFVPTRIYTC